MEPLEDLLQKTIAAIAGQQKVPGATYRLQFHAGFTFRDAERLVPCLHDLGITHCYASPYLKARPGSQHGYDITNHNMLNPEIGSEEDYAAWVTALHAHGMGQILDTVPNHMGIVGNENMWWNDVLENGPASPYANFFDIAWHASPRPSLHEKVLLPILGEPYGKVLEAQQIRLHYHAGTFSITYFDHRYPVAPCTYGMILSQPLEELQGRLEATAPPLVEYQSILTAISHLPRRSENDPARVAERQRESEVIKRRLAKLTEENATMREAVERTVTLFNGQPGDPHSFDLLDGLLDAQAYRLAFWRVAADEINYRRFFDVNELAALSMERPEVFTATHELILRLLSERKVNGLRIDHPDGLYDPRQYLQRLQNHFVLACARRVFETQAEYLGQEWKNFEAPLLELIETRSRQDREGPLWRPLYVIVEKILGAVETLPDDWPTYGTSGYDFLNMVNGLFVDAGNAQAFTQIYHRWIGADVSFPELAYRSKYLILQVALSSELHTLAQQLDRLAQRQRSSRDFTFTSLRHALRDIIACFPVYRSYIAGDEIHDADRKYVQTAVARARGRNPALNKALFDFVGDMVLLKYPETATPEDRAEQRRFAGKFQQVTSPVMAKGLEDTAFYLYNRLLALNEVGGTPERFGRSPASVHRSFQERQAHWPLAMSASSTHDTKRSEDVRARLNVLSELPDQWHERLLRWSELNRPERSEIDELTVPGPNEEYFLYQTLLGAWPLEPYDTEQYGAFVDRIRAYMRKAIHEAKMHTSWINPDVAYDEAVDRFVASILDPEKSSLFIDDLRAFAKYVSHCGLFNALAQTLLKIAAPGVPDTYQGTEIWDFSLVDPDNRRLVDYERRRQMLRALQEEVKVAGSKVAELSEALMRTKEDGRIKLYVTYRALHCSREHPGLFTSGEFIPLDAGGARQEHVFGFIRRAGNKRALAVVPRLFTKLVPSVNHLPCGRDLWQDTVLQLPDTDAKERWQNIFTGEAVAASSQSGHTVIAAADLFAHFPVALLIAEE
jgi:(1->4)-alpha-D-glucan 1-alpha-D-glucosylmutase